MNNYAFDKEKELKDVGVIPELPGFYGRALYPVRKFNTPITARENFLRVVNNEMPLWLPTMTTDFNFIQPIIMPDARTRIYGGFDWFGIEWEREENINAAMVKPGTRRLSDITNWKEELVFPDLNDIDWQKDYEENYKPVLDPDRPTMFVIVNGLFERTADLTSFEDTFCYLLEEQEVLQEFYDKLADWHIDLIKIAKNVYGAEVITFHDDMGTQKSSFFSPEIFKEVMLPHYKKIVDAAHDMGLYVNFHSCGAVGNQMENFIEVGFDFWEGQDDCNDKFEIIEKYGDKIGQVGAFLLPPDMSDEEFDKAVIERVQSSLGRSGRYIIWARELDEERRDRQFELIYTTSREMYSQCQVVSE